MNRACMQKGRGQYSYLTDRILSTYQYIAKCIAIQINGSMHIQDDIIFPCVSDHLSGHDHSFVVNLEYFVVVTI